MDDVATSILLPLIAAAGMIVALTVSTFGVMSSLHVGSHSADHR